MYIERNYSLTQEQDYAINVAPYIQRKGRAEGVYIMRNPAPTLTGWNLVNMGANTQIDSSYPGNNPSLTVITNNFPPIQQSLPNKYNGHTK